MLTKDELKIAIEQAFLPLRCVTRFHYEQHISFRIFAPNGELVEEFPDLIVANALNEQYLNPILDSVRQRVRDKGFTLNK